MNNRPLALTLAFLLSASLLGCASPLGADPTLPPGTGTPPTAQPTEAVSPLPTPGPEVSRATSPQVAEGDLSELVSGNSSFAFDLYHALRAAEGNLFFSPHSVSLALAMTYAGARGDTQQQMAETLHFLLAPDRLHPAFNALDMALAARGEDAEGKDGKGFRLHIANALWGQEGYPFLAEFLDVLAQNYAAGLSLVDFAADAEAARSTINDWIEEQTEGRIKDLLPPGVIDAATRLVLTNAIYFNAAWLHPFEPGLTQDGAFHLLDGGQVMVPMMRLPAPEALGYGDGEGYQAVDLPYDGNELSMVVLLPDQGTFSAFEESLDAGRVADILQALQPAQVALTMPGFEFESAFSLKDVLDGMGMTAAFSPDADFSGMTGNRDLFISAVIHKAFVGVDEAGTEAAAATAVVMAESAAPAEPLELRIDRPFVFLIRDIETGAILFVGRVVDPRP